MNLPPRAQKCCSIKSTSQHTLLVRAAGTLYPSRSLQSLVDDQAEISYSLHVKESHIEQHPAAKHCYFTQQFCNYSICYLTNMYI